MKAFSTFLVTLCALNFMAQDYNLNGNLIVGSDSTNTLDVTGDGRIQGDARIDGGLKLSSMAAPATPYPKIIYADENGRLEQMSTQQIDDLLMAVYGLDCKGEIGQETPVWQNAPNIIFVKDPCVPDPRVGINQDTPQSTLHVVGRGIISDLQSVNFGQFQNQDLLVYSDGGNSSEYGVRVACDEAIYKPFAVSNKTTGEDSFRVMSNGNVITTKVTVLEMQNFPDYVFEDDYKLMPLGELERYIENNKHLPNMPSSTEVRDGGADLGELMRLLTEKVEELTLYTIQQEAEILSLQNQVEQLNNVVQTQRK